MLIVVTAALALASAAPDIAITIAARTQQPGELIVVTLATDPAAKDVRVRAFGQVIPAYETTSAKWQALVGVDIDQRPGAYSITAEARVNGALVTAQRELNILPKRFPTRKLMVSPEFVDPPASMA